MDGDVSLKNVDIQADLPDDNQVSDEENGFPDDSDFMQALRELAENQEMAPGIVLEESQDQYEYGSCHNRPQVPVHRTIIRRRDLLIAASIIVVFLFSVWMSIFPPKETPDAPPLPSPVMAQSVNNLYPSQLNLTVSLVPKSL